MSYWMISGRRSGVRWVALLAASCVCISAAQKVKVKIVDRSDSESSYTYVVPQHIQSGSSSNVNCTAYPNSVGCAGTTSTTATVSPSYVGSFSVRGATYSLLLSDGRVAVVNCEIKRNHTQWNGQAWRSCRMPIVDDIEVEFNGSNAKLFWPVSIDGKKLESETYKIVGILKPQ